MVDVDLVLARHVHGIDVNIQAGYGMESLPRRYVAPHERQAVRRLLGFKEVRLGSKHATVVTGDHASSLAQATYKIMESLHY